MGIILISIALIAIGIFLVRADFDWGFIFTFLGSGVLILCLIIIMMVILYGKNNMISYQYDKVKIETAINNPQLTGEERTSAIDLITNDNQIITNIKYWRDNFWIGVFYYYPIGDLPLFDITKVPTATASVLLKN